MADQIIDILLVEDSQDDATFFVEALKEVSPRALLQIARDGAEALAILFGERDSYAALPMVRPRLIVLDLKLPKVGGMEVLRRLRSNPQTRTIPIVVLSSSNERRDLSESYQLGVNSYLVKPMDFDEFTELVHTLGAYWLRFNQAPRL
jgi:two-component system, response regulator